MKILVSTMPYTGHFNPMQPIVKELVSRGHEVVWITGSNYAAKVEACGVRFIEMSQDAVLKAEDTQQPSSTGASSLAEGQKMMRKMFIDRIPAQVRDYQAALETFKADILLVEFCTFGAHALRDLTGLPYATLGINPLSTVAPEIPPYGSRKQPPANTLGRWSNIAQHALANLIFFQPLNRTVNEIRTRELGLPTLDPGTNFADLFHSETLHIMMTTPVFEFPRKNLRPSIKFVGPLIPAIDDSEFQQPTWWNELLASPREKVVHVTQGTVATEASKLIIPTTRALSAIPDLLVILTGEGIEGKLQREQNIDNRRGSAPLLPSNVRTARFIPHTRLLPHVGAMVTNGGYNGVLAALSCGTPLVCAGAGEDKEDVGARVTWAGVGIDLATDTPTDRALREAILLVLNDSKYRNAAETVRKDFASHNGPVEAVDALEAVVLGTS